jgi:FkbM family methyltransferase
MIRAALSRLKGRLRYFFSLPGFKKNPLRVIWRTFVWRIKCGLGIPGLVRVPVWSNAKICLPPEWHGAGATLFYAVRQDYEPELTFLDRVLKAGETFVDAGANCGLYTIAAASIVERDGLVLAFEPGKEVFGTLKQNVELNHFDQVRLFEIGLADKSITAPLYKHPHGSSSFSLGKIANNVEESSAITLRRLDDVLAEQGVEIVHCLKMDVEGAEELILRGATSLFEKCKPRVIFEINPPAIEALQLEMFGAWQFLEARGYQFFTMDPDGNMTQLTSRSAGANVVALPQGPIGS